MRNIATISGGKASAWCAYYVASKYGTNDLLLYFNDTKWEHDDLYRFNNDIAKLIGIPITEDSDGRSVEDVFWDNNALANNRMPFCSRILKAERLQKFCENGDTLFFGIGIEEQHRALRIEQVYSEVQRKRKISIKVRFPLIETGTSKQDVDEWLLSVGVKPPFLYSLGFTHNNCSGGCVRAGKKQWVRLLKTLPDVYAKREALEVEMSEYLGKKVSYLKDESLQELRERYERGDLSTYYDDLEYTSGECIGICSMFN